jgi:hypothetical protein
VSPAPGAGVPQNTMRKVHRVVSIVFTLTVLANFVAMGIGLPAEKAQWVGLSAIPPLLLLLCTGLYLFVLPYTKRGRSRASADEAHAS